MCDSLSGRTRQGRASGFFRSRWNFAKFLTRQAWIFPRRSDRILQSYDSSAGDSDTKMTGPYAVVFAGKNVRRVGGFQRRLDVDEIDEFTGVSVYLNFL